MHIHNGRKHVRDSGVKPFRSIFLRFLLIFPRRYREWATRAAVVAVVHWSDRYIRQTVRFVIRRFLFSLYVYSLIELSLRIKASQQDILQIYFKERTKYLPPDSFSSFSSLLCHGGRIEFATGHQKNTLTKSGSKTKKERHRSRWKTDQRLERFGFPEEAPRIRSRQSEASPNRVQKWRDRFGRWSARQGEMEAGKKLLNPIWISGPLNGGLISSKDISRSSFEKEPKHRAAIAVYLWMEREQKGKRKSGTRRRLIPTIHPST